MKSTSAKGGIELSEFRFAPNAIVQDFVNSRLLIDLFSIVDKAVDEQFDFYGLKEERKKSKPTTLNENNKVYNHPYLIWYKEWRNDAAHHFGTIPYHRLRQASGGVRKQLMEWQLIAYEFDAYSFEKQIDENTFQYGVTIRSIAILVYRITYWESGCNWEKLINLTSQQYLEALLKGAT